MTDFVIRVTIDPKGAVTGGKQVEGALKGVQKESKKSSTSLATAAKAIAASLVVREVIAAATIYQELQNKLTLVTTGTENLADVTEELFAISQRTRGSFEGTADLYSRVARSVVELGVSQRETLGFTEAVSKAIAISGASAIEAKSGIIQLGQGLASGAIRGDELRSVLENLPGLAREIAAGLGTTVGGLRKLGGEGALTGEAVFGAIQKRIPQITAQFEQLTPTIGQAFTVLQNSGLKAVGTLAKVTGGADLLAGLVIKAAENLDLLVKAFSDTLEPGDELSSQMATLAIGVIAAGTAFSALFSSLKAGAGLFTAFGEGLGGTIAGLVALASGDLDLAKTIFEDTSGFDNATLAVTDYFEEFATGIDSASLKINDVLLPAFRAIKKEQSTITEGVTDLDLDLGAAAAALALEKLREKQAEFIADLEQMNKALAISAETGKDLNLVLEDLELIKLSGGDKVFLAEAQALLEAARNGQAYADAKERLFEEGRENKAFIEDLQTENEAMTRAIETGEELSDVLAELAIRARFIGDEKTLGEALDLQQANIKLREQLDEAEDEVDDFLRRARENSQDVLAGFLADPMAEGLDDLGRQFSKVLLDLAAQALASEIFKLLGNIGKDASGASVGGILGSIGEFFGGAASGADVGGGDFGVVGEKGPELFQAPTAGRIVPNQAAAAAPNVNVPVTIVNTIDPSDITGAFNTGEGQKVLLNMLSTKRNSSRKALGIG